MAHILVAIVYAELHYAQLPSFSRVCVLNISEIQRIKASFYIGVNLAGIVGDAEADPEGLGRGLGPPGEGSGEN